MDYSQHGIARRYSQGRALPEAALARWASAVLPLLPAVHEPLVLDIGAGTGIFARAWPQWRRCRLIALEPAGAMRAELTRDDLPDAVSVIAGRAERLPLRDESVDVAWLSTVIHHLGSLATCAAELRRVLTADGVVLVRGLFADLGQPAALGFLPGSEHARAAFPATDTIATEFAGHGLRTVCEREVEDAGPSTVRDAADRIRRLRRADSLLARFSDEQIADGLAALERREPTELLEPTTLGLLAFTVQ